MSKRIGYGRTYSMPPVAENPELKTLQRVVGLLEQAGIPYMLTGSMALNVYGHPRATNDFDIVIEIETRDENRLLALFEENYYVSRDAIRPALAQESLFNIIDNETVFKIDLIVKKRTPYAAEQFRRRRVEELQGFKTLVISPEDLILAKLDWSRESLSEMQGRDIGGLIRLVSKNLDFAYMENWASVLGVLDRLRGFYVSP